MLFVRQLALGAVPSVHVPLDGQCQDNKKVNLMMGRL